MRAIIMAGGAGRRMAASGEQRPKPLVSVAGVPLIERNLCALLRHGYREVYLAVRRPNPAFTTSHRPSEQHGARPDSHSEVHAWAAERGAPIAAACGGTLRPFSEPEPWGTVGAVGALVGLEEFPQDTLLVFADNLTALDLTALASAHRKSGAAMTLAVHSEPFTIPFGVPSIVEGHVVEYVEKPTHPVTVATGVYVLGSAALRSAADCADPLGANTLVQRLIDAGETVRAFAHEARWWDVNDRSTQARAEQSVADDPSFDRWAPRVDREVVGALILRGQDALLELRPGHADTYPGAWDTPGGKIEPGETPEAALRREIGEELGARLTAIEPLGAFDDVDLCTGRIVRHHPFAVLIDRPAEPREGQTLAYRPVQNAASADDCAYPCRRTAQRWTRRQELPHA